MKIELCECEHTHKDLINTRLPDEEILLKIADLFKIFGDTTRTKILSALFNHELCVCDICKIVKMNKSAVSHQLRVLRTYNLVKFRKQGKEVFYSLADEHVVMIYKMAIEHILEKKENDEDEESI